MSTDGGLGSNAGASAAGGASATGGAGTQSAAGGSVNLTGGQSGATGGVSAGGAAGNISTQAGGSSNQQGGTPSSGGTPSAVSGAGGLAGGSPNLSGGAASVGGATASGGTTSVSSGGRAMNGGTTSRGGAPSSGGRTSSTGGRSSTGGVSSGGTSASAGASSGGAATSGGAGSSGKAFSQCRFHFGTIDSVAANNPSLLAELDYFTPGWMGQKDTFDMQYVCDEAKAGAKFQNQVPVIVAYVAAFHAKRHLNLKDCNVSGSQQSLCQVGAQYLQEHLPEIVATYESYGKGFASCYGTTRPIIFEMEPDFYQYTYSDQSRPISAQLAGQIMSQFVNALKKSLPNAFFSMDISPWVAPNNGSDFGKSWYSNFDMSLFTFINTSGGGTDAASAKIRSSNSMTWAGVSQVTGKPILADTGYGVNGSSAGHDSAWDSPSNINARIDDGVIGVSQYNPNANWGSTISSLRKQLKTPRFCP